MTPRLDATPDLPSFPRERTWLLPALRAEQRGQGWLSPEALQAIAAHLRVPASEVWGVASHYPELRLRRPGRRVVRVCTGVSCRVRGGLDLLAACERRLGLRAGETTADATLEEMDCAFACGVAPVVAVGHAVHGRVTPGALGDLLVARAAGPASPGAASGSADIRPPAGAHDALPGPARAHASGLSDAEQAPRARLAALRRAAAAGEPGAARGRAARGATTRLLVGVGSCGLAVGAAETLAALRHAVERRGLAVEVVAAGCTGMCWAAPTVTRVVAGQPPVVAGRVSPDGVEALVEALAGDGHPGAPMSIPAPFRHERRMLLEHCGLDDPVAIAAAVRRGAYESLARALASGSPDAVIEEVRAAGLQGRGGAYFQTAVKWAAARAAKGQPKYVVVNGEEGEPGIFKDRHLMEGDPHLLIEGALLAAYAVGASRVILYVHGEADLSAERLAAALAEARAWGLVGPEILGTPFSVETEIRRGAGGFVLGEETALLESLEGRRAMPRVRPPFPVESGLFGRPTVINNVETLCAVPRVLTRGGAAFAATGRGHGTKLFGLSGHLERPGVVEMEVGCTLRTLIEDVGGGSLGGRPLKAAVIGGPSGSVIPPRLLDEPLVPRGPVNPGTGGVVALTDGASVADVVRTLLGFNQRESCGKCTPCREGTARLLHLLAAGADRATVKDLAETIQVASLCGLGQAAPHAVLSGLAEFPGEFGVAAGRTP